MGNNQSQSPDSDGEESPRYTFHEDVLREAQINAPIAAGTSVTGAIPPPHISSGILSDDEFFSAEEGDSVGSITPPRTRPESSSGEDFSDDSDDNIDDRSLHQADDGESPDVSLSVESIEEGEFVVPHVPDKVTPRGGRPLRSTRSCGQCSVSVDHDQDSIGPELESSQSLSVTQDSDGSRAATPRTRQSQRLRTASTNQISEQNTPGRQTSSSQDKVSPFKPIFSPLTGTGESQTASLILAAQAGKRKAQRGTMRVVENTRVTVPVTRRATRSSQQSRQRLGIIDSSDSDESESEGSKRFSKKGRYIKKSPETKRKRGQGQDRVQDLNSSTESQLPKKKKRWSGSSKTADSDESCEDGSEKRQSCGSSEASSCQSEEKSPMPDIGKRRHSDKPSSRQRQPETSDSDELSDAQQNRNKRSRLSHKRLSHSPRDGKRELNVRSPSHSKNPEEEDFGTSRRTRSGAVSRNTDQYSETFPSRIKRLRIGAYNPPYHRPSSVADEEVNSVKSASSAAMISNQTTDSEVNAFVSESERKNYAVFSSLEGARELSGKKLSPKISKDENADSESLPPESVIASDVNASSREDGDHQEINLLNSSKMGDQGIRNVHGKIVPLRQHVSLANNAASSSVSTESSQQSEQPSLPKFPNLTVNLRTKNSAFSKPLQETQMETREGNVSNLVNSSAYSTTRSRKGLIVSSPVTSDGSNSEADGYFSVSEEQKLPPSPLRDLVLIPPSQMKDKNNSNSGSRGQKRERTEDQAPGEDSCLETDMEVETGAQSFLAFPYPSNEQPRTILTGKRTGRSAAERFKNFWSKRKNIGDNIKTFFSKVNSSSTKSPTLFENMGSIKQRLLSSGATHKRGLSTLPAHHSSSLSSSFFQNKQPSLLRDTRSGQPTQLYHSSREMAAGSIGPGQRLSLPSWSSPRISTNRISLRNYRREPTVHSTGTQTLDSADDQSADLVELLPQTSLYEVLHFRLANFLEVSVCMGDISEQLTTGIVNWTDGALSHSITECSQNIASKGGTLMRTACKDYLETKGGSLEAPDVLLTPAGGKFDSCVETILHVTTPEEAELYDDEERGIHALLEVYANCLRFTNERLSLRSVSFPLIGQDIFPAGVCVRAFLNSLLIFLAELSLSSSTNSSPPNLSFINLVISDAVTTDFAADFLHQCLERISSDGLELAVTEMYNFFCEQTQRQLMKRDSVSPKKTPSLIKQTEQIADNPLRSPSGRPKMKRRRL
ncbi:uncharacterized protein LOC101856611 [Aplysia californica]|uniref:Uncharacterized protein LOC101856611 n=1 Tax=Aplysia californica TaxID=6500 RepID=A0ABM1W1D0_APLCA|nr:uncharacterized protein LOC101856611 [Aplysia californica]XP_035828473.1 uncharacterized protein LOC101856611 [Aplysia californica]